MAEYSTAIMDGGATPSTRLVRLINRTGAALAVGDVAGLNLSFVDTYIGTDPSDNSKTATGYVYGAAVAITTEIAARRCFVAAQPIAIDAPGLFVAKGICQCKMTTGLVGNFLYTDNAHTYATPATLSGLDGLTVPTKIYGYCIVASSGIAVGTADWDCDGMGFAGGGA